jgi:hypothetical protein
LTALASIGLSVPSPKQRSSHHWHLQPWGARWPPRQRHHAKTAQRWQNGPNFAASELLPHRGSTMLGAAEEEEEIGWGIGQGAALRSLERQQQQQHQLQSSERQQETRTTRKSAELRHVKHVRLMPGAAAAAEASAGER